MLNILLLLLLYKNGSAVQGCETVRTLYQSEDPNPTQPTQEGRKRENSRRHKERAD